MDAYIEGHGEELEHTYLEVELKEDPHTELQLEAAAEGGSEGSKPESDDRATVGGEAAAATEADAEAEAEAQEEKQAPANKAAEEEGAGAEEVVPVHTISHVTIHLTSASAASEEPSAAPAGQHQQHQQQQQQQVLLRTLVDLEKSLEIEPPPGPISLLEKRNLKKKTAAQEQEERVNLEGERQVAMMSAGQRVLQPPLCQDPHSHASETETETHSHGRHAVQESRVLRVITGAMPLRDSSSGQIQQRPRQPERPLSAIAVGDGEARLRANKELKEAAALRAARLNSTRNSTRNHSSTAASAPPPTAGGGGGGGSPRVHWGVEGRGGAVLQGVGGVVGGASVGRGSRSPVRVPSVVSRWVKEWVESDCGGGDGRGGGRSGGGAGRGGTAYAAEVEHAVQRSECEEGEAVAKEEGEVWEEAEAAPEEGVLPQLPPWVVQVPVLVLTLEPTGKGAWEQLLDNSKAHSALQERWVTATPLEPAATARRGGSRGGGALALSLNAPAVEPQLHSARNRSGTPRALEPASATPRAFEAGSHRWRFAERSVGPAVADCQWRSSLRTKDSLRQLPGAVANKAVGLRMMTSGIGDVRLMRQHCLLACHANMEDMEEHGKLVLRGPVCPVALVHQPK